MRGYYRAVDAVVCPDKIATHEQTSSRHRPEAIIPAAVDCEKSQVSDQESGRASGTRTRNLWIKSPQLCQLS